MADKETAAKKAAKIFFDVLLLGMDAAIEKHRKIACRGTEQKPEGHASRFGSPLLDFR